MTAGTRVLQFSSLAFDASVSELLVTLGNGGTLCVGEGPWAGRELATMLRDWRIQLVTLPPSVLSTLPEERFPYLTTVVVAGEACSADKTAFTLARRKSR